MMCYHVSQEGQSCIFPIPLNWAIFLNKNLWYFIMCSVCILSYVSQNGQSCHHTCGLAHQSTSATVPCCCTATCVTEPRLYTFLRSVTLAWLWPGTPIHLALASVLPFCTVPHGGEGRLEMSCWMGDAKQGHWVPAMRLEWGGSIVLCASVRQGSLLLWFWSEPWSCWEWGESSDRILSERLLSGWRQVVVVLYFVKDSQPPCSY